MPELQEGIYFGPGDRPRDHFRFVTFNFSDDATPATARSALEILWAVLGDLKRGIVRDLTGTRETDPSIRVKSGELTALLAFGPRLFSAEVRQRALVPKEALPDGLVPFDTAPTGPFPALRWSPAMATAAAQTDFAIQLIGCTELSVARPLVELQKAIDDHDLPVRLVCFFSGLHRDDERSWIDFHDGINNLRSSERQGVIQIGQSAHDWTQGGTTLAFLKIAVDLAAWRRLSREEQELLVGRDKLSGCPLTAARFGAAGQVQIDLSTHCVPGEVINKKTSPSRVIDPARSGNAIVQRSHIHRTNRNRTAGADDPASSRIFRQGYEFVDSPPEGGVRVGLNFVSFQNSLDRVVNILLADGWMGDANFGGWPGRRPAPLQLLSVIAGGFFVVPPAGEPFPGASIFEEPALVAEGHDTASAARGGERREV